MKMPRSFSLLSVLTAAALLPAAFTAMFAAMPAAAGETPFVVELFTSQGCSSCPPADALLARLATRPSTIVLSMPVDYWDYIGWKDTLASPHFSARQRAYAAARGDGKVYTPQAVVDGLVDVVGSDETKLLAAASTHYGVGGAMTVPVEVRPHDRRLSIEVGEAPRENVTAAAVWLLRVSKARSVPVGRGENRGRTLTYTNVVRSVTRLGEYDGRAARFEAPLADTLGADTDGVVVLVQAGTADRPGAILGAGIGP